ncbi:asparagine synthase (glutamine-hydrolyzing) [Rhodopseudomonas palustris]|uniref:asparagine synthase (glutamine-hydrolyzing) n=1 Tax=Rhodopseudomonas palustris (strain BisB18) TaxID=316056 RepID=Q20ZN3_RHOPB
MCGFVAAIALTDHASIDRRSVELATDLLGHRGPDASNLVHDSQFSFGHRRLSIIDLGARSDQPFSDPSESVTLVYNGEIYNYRELRRELAAKGAQFRTTGDTEVVLQAYLIWGDDLVHHLDGIFAFVLFDRRRRRALVVRDPLGVKPVYYARHGDILLVGSEPKAITAFNGFKVSLDAATISAFLTFRYAIEAEQWICGVLQLLPGHRLRVESGRVDNSAYWRVEAARPCVAGAEGVAAAIRHAVSSQLLSDVPVGLLLSGGVDSSVIAAAATVATEALGEPPLRAYTAALADSRCDETRYAAEVATHLNIPLTPVAVEPLVLRETVDMLVNCRDGPLGMHNEIAMFALASAVRRDAKVLLCGEGADETFAGYTRLFRLPFDIARIRGLSRLPAVVRGPLARAIDVPEFCPTDPMSLFFERYGYFSQHEKAELFRPEVWEAIDHDRRLWSYIDDRLRPSADRPLIDRIGHFFVGLHLPGLLGMIDGTTMAAGVEARVPFCDRRLVELALSLPQQDKIMWRSRLHGIRAAFQPIARFSEQADCSKVVIRRIYGESLPKNVTSRRKMGFPTPLRAWIWGQLAELRQDMLESAASPLFMYFREQPIRCWLEKSRRGDDGPSRKLWMLMTLGVFLSGLTHGATRSGRAKEYHEAHY